MELVRNMSLFGCREYFAERRSVPASIYAHDDADNLGPRQTMIFGNNITEGPLNTVTSGQPVRQCMVIAAVSVLTLGAGCVSPKTIPLSEPAVSAIEQSQALIRDKGTH